ncbi:Rgg/GadR/MutR family transcriptional regulator [Lactococcus lactis]|uniref:Rgg/GadR/MutR family transcriptional regulator n=1 Tax=Lactococcus lactis TaxID=1358 RepID=UPI0022E44901|nr:Rgg/GadR/MutR family transcriptional regulator [Lactococcus lactis]
MKKTIERNSDRELAYGIVFKNLRVAKGFSQEEASGQEISPTHLSNFENGKTMISIDRFFNLLQNINVNMFEFQNALNLYLEKRDLLLFNMEMAKALVERNSAKLHQIVNNLEQHLNVSNSKPISKKLKLDYIRAKSILSFMDSNYYINREEILFLENYLFSLKEWGQYDVALLGQCAKFIDLIHLMQLTEKMLSPFQTSNNIPYVKQAIIQTVLNIIEVYLENGTYEPARRLIRYLETSDIHDYYMFEKITLIYTKANCLYHTGDETALEIMKKCQEILEFCDCSKTANWVADEINELLRNDHT